ncbi:MAG: hypothetical protein AB7G80_04290 [Dongiaceae bacterium]
MTSDNSGEKGLPPMEPGEEKLYGEYALSFEQHMAEGQLPYHQQLKRARFMVAFYRQEIGEWVQRYRLWLRDAAYRQANGEVVARTHIGFQTKLRRAWKLYRLAQKLVGDLEQRRQMRLDLQHNPRPTNPYGRADWANMDEKQLYEYLELRYGIGYALQVMEEFRKARARNAYRPKRVA